MTLRERAVRSDELAISDITMSRDRIEVIEVMDRADVRPIVRGSLAASQLDAQ